MVKKKKKKKAIARKRTQAKGKAKSKPKKKRTATSKADDYELPLNLTPRPSLSDLKAPPGFRTISISQALIIYAEPIIDFFDRGVLNDLNEAIQLALPLWNYSINIEDRPGSLSRGTLIRQIRRMLKLKQTEANEFFDMMIRRKEYLCPSEIQPKVSTLLFIRNESNPVLEPIDGEELQLSEREYIATDDDQELVRSLDKLDDSEIEDDEYETREKFYFMVEEKCRQRYQNWLNYKGLEKYSENFSYHVAFFLDFVYRHAYSYSIGLKKLSVYDIDDFLFDHLIRKMLVEPHEYLEWPPALKMFYQFLKDIGYMKSVQRVINHLDKIEPKFLKFLRERYT